jgi:hypothetical protein
VLIDKMIKWLILIYTVCLFCLNGCNNSTHVPVTQSADPVVARVNGRPIRQSQLLEALLPGYGRRMLDELMLLEIVRQHAEESDINSDETLVEAELMSVLEDMAPGKSPEHKLALLDYMLKSRGMTRAEFDFIIERQVLLRQMVDPNVVVTEEMLSREYERQYGRKVLVKQLVVRSLRQIEEVQRKLETGIDFSTLVQEMSQDEVTLSEGGLLGPFTQQDTRIPPEVRREAFKLENLGDRSGIIRYRDQQKQEYWCLLQLERHISAEQVELATVREELIEGLRTRLIKERMLKLQDNLQKQATITVLEPKLRSKGSGR